VCERTYYYSLLSVIMSHMWWNTCVFSFKEPFVQWKGHNVLNGNISTESVRKRP